MERRKAAKQHGGWAPWDEGEGMLELRFSNEETEALSDTTFV